MITTLQRMPTRQVPTNLKLPTQQQVIDILETTPVVGLAWQTPATPGTPVNALDVNLRGGYIYNPIDAPANLFVDPVVPASVTANGTTMALVPGQSFFAISFSTNFVSVASTIASHSFVSVQWA
jgi:hypothetical protein